MTLAQARAFTLRLQEVYAYYCNLIRSTTSQSNPDSFFADFFPWYFGPSSIPAQFPRWLAELTPQAIFEMVGQTRLYCPELVTMGSIAFGLIIPELNVSLLDPFTPEEENA